MHYTEQEMREACERASSEIVKKNDQLGEFIRGQNDCFAFLVEYDRALRGGGSKMNDISLRPYKNSLDFMRSIRKAGFRDLQSLGEHCGYRSRDIKRPEHGDIAYELKPSSRLGSAMVAIDGFWNTITEDLSGITVKRQTFHYERDLVFLAQPIRS